MGFASASEVERFLKICPEVEQYIVDAGVLLIKFWLEVGQEEQEKRFSARINDPLRQWKLSPMDVESYARWYDYSRARDMMLKATDVDHAPWHIVKSDDKRRGRLNCISQILELDSLQENVAAEGQAAKAIGQAQIRRSGVFARPEFRSREVLTLTSLAGAGLAR